MNDLISKQEVLDTLFNIINEMQYKGIIIYEQAVELRMRIRMELG